METVEQKRDVRNHSIKSEDLVEQVLEVIDIYPPIIKKMDWKLIGDPKSIHPKILEKAVDNLSRNQKKKLRNLIRKTIKHRSMKLFNQLFHVLIKILEDQKKKSLVSFLNLGKQYDKQIKLNIGDKEKIIKKSRKEWLLAKEKAELALNVYKFNKSDFYIKRLKNV